MLNIISVHWMQSNMTGKCFPHWCKNWLGSSTKKKMEDGVHNSGYVWSVNNKECLSTKDFKVVLSFLFFFFFCLDLADFKIVLFFLF